VNPDLDVVDGGVARGCGRVLAEVGIDAAVAQFGDELFC
jgi:hypothetical protein